MSPQDVPTAFQGTHYIHHLRHLWTSAINFLLCFCFFSADFQHHGSLFTLFLHSPLTALCYVCNVGDVPIHHWDRCQGYIDKFVTEASRLVTRCRIDEIEKGIGCIGIDFYWSIIILHPPSNRSIFFCPYSTDSSYVQFFGDDFLRTLILRFVFCDVVLRIHRSFRGRHQRPRCEPPLPTAELLEHPSLSHIILQLATALDVRSHFNDAPENEWCTQLSVGRSALRVYGWGLDTIQPTKI